MSRRPWPAAVALVLMCAPPAVGTDETRLVARVVDPVSQRAVAGATVVMGSDRGRTGENGRVRLRSDAAGRDHLRARVRARGSRPYETWVPAGERTRRRFHLFPRGSVDLPVGDDSIPASLLLEHFDVVHRSPQSREVVQRWVEQPRIFIGSHVMATDGGDDGWRMFATDRRLPGEVIRRIRQGVRDGIGPLSGGLLRPGALRVREWSPGEIVGRAPEEVAPAGELVVYVHDTGYFSSGAVTVMEGDVVIGGYVYLDLSTMSEHQVFYDPFLLVHEFAHLFGMNHPSDGGSSRVPLCSIMNTGDCGDLALPTMPTLSVFDAITARLAYARLPGNDRDDRDPVPEAGAAPAATTVRRVDGLAHGGRAPVPARRPRRR